MFNVLDAVVDDHHFKDEALFYRFRQDDKTSVKDHNQRVTLMQGVRMYHIMKHTQPALISDKVCLMRVCLCLCLCVSMFACIFHFISSLISSPLFHGCFEGSALMMMMMMMMAMVTFYVFQSFHLQKYPRVFIASEFLDWITDAEFCANRTDALAFASALFELKFFQHW